MIYKATGYIRAIQILLGHTKIENAVRYLGVDIEDALLLAERTEISLGSGLSASGWVAFDRDGNAPQNGHSCCDCVFPKADVRPAWGEWLRLVKFRSDVVRRGGPAWTGEPRPLGLCWRLNPFALRIIERLAGDPERLALSPQDRVMMCGSWMNKLAE